MPKKVLPKSSDFAYISHELEKLDFKQISVNEFCETFKRLNLKAPRPRQGRETGFVFTRHGLRVVVWTTWIKSQGKARDTDAAWIVIAKGDKALYFSHPIHRTKNFCVNLLKQTWIARHRVLHRPHCSECGRFMEIASGKGVKSRYWCCFNKSGHKSNNLVYLEWDYNLPEKAQKYVNGLRKKRAKHRNEVRKQNKPLNQAMIKRRLWVKGK